MPTVVKPAVDHDGAVDDHVGDALSVPVDAADVWAAYANTMKAAEKLGRAGEVRGRIRTLVAGETFGERGAATTAAGQGERSAELTDRSVGASPSGAPGYPNMRRCGTSVRATSARNCSTAAGSMDGSAGRQMR